MLKNYRWLILTVVIIALDQWTKVLASQHLVLYQSLPLTSFFNLTLSHNTGAAFSLLHDVNGWQRWFFATVAIAASIIILIWLYKLPARKPLVAIALCLVLGGALANLWDRMTLGYVVDFLDFYLGNYHWPAFNVADTAIVIGVFLLIIDTLGKHQNEVRK